jgi:cyclophilin family peptidyl-prolyl cis-trans isomerase
MTDFEYIVPAHIPLGQSFNIFTPEGQPMRLNLTQHVQPGDKLILSRHEAGYQVTKIFRSPVSQQPQFMHHAPMLPNLQNSMAVLPSRPYMQVNTSGSAVNSVSPARISILERSSRSFEMQIPLGVPPNSTLTLTNPRCPMRSTFQWTMPRNCLPGDLVQFTHDGKKYVLSRITHSNPSTALAMSSPSGRVAPSSPDVAMSDYICSLQTTKGRLSIRVIPSLAPIAAARWADLLQDGFFDDLPVYRALAGFLLQFGVTKGGSGAGKYPPLPDDAHRGIPIAKGSIIFAAAGPNTRRATVCIFLDDLPQFGNNSWETPFAYVEDDDESQRVLAALHTEYGDIPQCGGKGPDPIRLETEGPDFIRKEFPGIDFVTSAARC